MWRDIPSSAAIRRLLQPRSRSWRITSTSSGVCFALFKPNNPDKLGSANLTNTKADTRH